MKSQRAKNAVRRLLMSIFFLECIGMTSVYSQVHDSQHDIWGLNKIEERSEDFLPNLMQPIQQWLK